MRVCDEPGQPRDEKDRVAKLVAESEVRRDRRDGAVDVGGKETPEVIFASGECTLERAQHAHVLAFEFEFHRELKETRRAWVLRVQSMPKSRRRGGIGLRPIIDEFLGRLLR